MRTNRIDVAMDYGLRGIKVFPCKQDKSPLTQNGFKDATDDLDHILEWWTKYPDTLVGLPCGENGLTVIDFDCHKPDYQNCIHEFSDKYGISFDDHPYIVRTQNGGQHVYYCSPTKQKIRTTTSELVPGVDTRGCGGYVIAADGIGYKLLNEDYGCSPPALQSLPPLPNALEEILIKETIEEAQNIRREDIHELNDETTHRLKKALNVIDPDPYDTWIKVGMALHHVFNRSSDGFDLWCEWASRSQKYIQHEHIRKWNSFNSHIQNGVGVGTIFKLEKENIYNA